MVSPNNDDSSTETDVNWRYKFQAYFGRPPEYSQSHSYYDMFQQQFEQLKKELIAHQLTLDDLSYTCRNDIQLILAALLGQVNKTHSNSDHHPFTCIDQAIKSDRNFLLQATVIDPHIISYISDDVAASLSLDAIWQILSKIEDRKIREIAYTRLVEDKENKRPGVYPQKKKEILNLIDDYLISRSANTNLYSNMPLKIMFAYRAITPNMMTPLDEDACQYAGTRKYEPRMVPLSLGYGKYTKIYTAYELRKAILQENGQNLSHDQFDIVKQGKLGERLAKFVKDGKANNVFAAKHKFASLDNLFQFLQSQKKSASTSS